MTEAELLDKASAELLDKASAELVEEILTCEEGRPWFYVIRRKMEHLSYDLKERKQKHIEAINQTMTK